MTPKPVVMNNVGTRTNKAMDSQKRMKTMEVRSAKRMVLRRKVEKRRRGIEERPAWRARKAKRRGCSCANVLMLL